MYLVEIFTSKCVFETQLETDDRAIAVAEWNSCIRDGYDAILFWKEKEKCMTPHEKLLTKIGV